MSVLHRFFSPESEASAFEKLAARAWNVLNEGKPFTVVYVTAFAVLSGAPLRGIALAVLLTIVWWAHPYPLHLRAVLWPVAAGIVVVAGFPPLGVASLALLVYFIFTVVLWGSIYYHLRVGASLLNFWRFARLVAENPDPTSGNALEQIPKVAAGLAVAHSTTSSPSLLGVIGAAAVIGALVHRFAITWIPSSAIGTKPADRRPRDVGPALCGTPSRKVLIIVIDGCRADKLRIASTPFMDKLAEEGVYLEGITTVYPARTVTAFSSMFTGAPPAVHGMRSNFVPVRGVRCESIFDVVPRSKMIGIAHLDDAFGEHVTSVTSVMPNDRIDRALSDKALEVLDANELDLLVVQLLSVDQIGHVRGSYNTEYVRQIESVDREIEYLVEQVSRRWGGLDGVTIGILSDHGQGIGIGGHGHWSEPERVVPCIWWGAGISDELNRSATSIMDVTPTIAHRLGLRAPDASVGVCMLCEGANVPADTDPVVVVLPTFNEEDTVADVVNRVPANVHGHRTEVIVVDDGSTDRSATRAAQAGATVISMGLNQGLGAAVRRGFEAARERNAAAVVFLDADGEYDSAQLAAFTEPLVAGTSDYVVGNRFANGSPHMRPTQYIGNRILTAFTSLLVRQRLCDAQSGYRGLSRAALAVAEISHDYNYAQVLTLDLVRKGMRYSEVPISYRPRASGESFIRPVRYLRTVLPAVLRASAAR